MPRTSRKRNNRRNESTARVNSNLSPNAPEFIPLANDETTANQREHLVIQSMTVCGSSSASNSNGINSNEASTTISSIPDELKNKGQRDLLINLLNESKVDCVICYERAKNVEQIWNCRNCFQIMHLKCIIVWFIKSHCNAVWRCPACQSEITGKPKYVCFCGTLPNPYHNNVDTPHSCGQVCGLQKKNANVNYNDCHHKCTLLCHPGPCPQCVVQVLRSCGCGKKRVYAQCGQSTQIACNEVCRKKLNCQIHECEKICHANKCEPCNKGCPQNLNPPTSALVASNASFADAILQYNLLPPESVVTEEELRMLGLNPEEILQPRNVHDPFYSTSNESDDDEEFDVSNIDEIMQDIDFGYHNNSNINVVLAHPLSGYSNSHAYDFNFSLSDGDGDDEEEDDIGVVNDEDNEGCVLNNDDPREHYDTDHSWTENSSDEERAIVHTSSPMDSVESDNSWDMSDDIDEEVGEGNAISSSYSQNSANSSQSGISYLNDSNSSASSSSSSANASDSVCTSTSSSSSSF